MSGTGLEVRFEGQARVDAVLARLNSLAGRSDLYERTGAMVESQTRRRISEKKESPQGEEWLAWSPGYAGTRHGGHSLLQSEGHLLDSMVTAIEIGAKKAYVGSNLPYAPIHQFGGEPGMPPGPAAVPAREYLGISPENLEELEADLNAWADELTRGA